MSKMRVTLLIKDYDWIAPLVYGDVRAEGIDLNIVRDTPNALDRTLRDSSIDAGELSLGRHLLRRSVEDHSFVGIPNFVTRGFRHRCFFVRQRSGMNSLQDLAGKRVGTNEWPATGSTWSRAALREQGVDIETIHWWLGSVDGSLLQRPQGQLPSYVQSTPPGRGLLDMLLAADLDALMIPLPPPGFYELDSRVVRLIPDYRRAEQDYYLRTSIFPAHHIVGIRREVFEQDPRIARSLYTALGESRRRWQQSRRRLTETSPWLLTDLEETIQLMGDDWAPDGVDANIHTIQTLIDEQVAQGLASHRINASSAFTEFLEVM